MKNYLGEFEELVLLMVAIIPDEAYGNIIVNEIEEKTGRSANLSAVHVTLYRLEDKGFLKSEMGGATGSRGGRRKRIFKVTNAGMAQLKSQHDERVSLFSLIPQFKFQMR